MLLSLIVPVYLRSKSLKKFLKKMVNQTNSNYEIVFVIDTNSENILEIIESFEKDLKGKVKYIFNSTRCGRDEALSSSLKQITSKYSLLISYSDVFSKTFIANSLNILKNQDADIVEFDAIINEPIHFHGKARKSFSRPTDISKNPQIIAYSYPFDFNKFFKTSLLNEIVKKPLSTRVNSRFAIELVYKGLLFAKDYVYVSKNLVTSRSELSRNFNPLKIIRQWNNLQEFAIKNGYANYAKEIQYAKFFHETVFLFGFVHSSKNKIMLKKLFERFDLELKSKFKNFLLTNPYIVLKNHEAQIIKDNLAKNKITKLYKSIENENKK